ncbi:MAG: choice-of-anchor L domain-containing protein [Bryobacteraceae bacterium]
MRKLHAGLALAIASVMQAAPIVTAVSSDATALANALASGNPGIVINSATLGGDADVGTFTGATGLLPFADGIFLTTGVASCIPGPNNSVGCDGDTVTESILTIVFTPTGNTISFQYVFGSDEYPEFVSQNVNDTFTFLLNGTNIALVPGTGDTISVDTVNATQNSGYFTDNELGGIDLQYDGFVGLSQALFATGAVNPGVQNTLEIRIFDQGDDLYDSGVFLRGGSFVDAPPPGVPEPATVMITGAGLAGLALLRRRSSRR